MTNKEKILEIASTLCRNSQAEMSRRLGLSQTAVNTWLKRGTIDYEKISEELEHISMTIEALQLWCEKMKLGENK